MEIADGMEIERQKNVHKNERLAFLGQNMGSTMHSRSSDNAVRICSVTHDLVQVFQIFSVSGTSPINLGLTSAPVGSASDKR
jgi:hypothetical protein